MLWSGSSTLTVVRDGMWGFLLLAGAAWLAIAWSVLRLEPADLVAVAGPVILFGAVTEAVRALAGTRTWWLNAGLALLFATTGVIMLRDDGSSWTTPAALIGWYLLVRGAVDIAIAMLSRESDRIWGLLMVVGVLEVALGFFSASSFVRTPELVIVVLGGAAVARGVADLVASLRLREAAAGSRPELTPERASAAARSRPELTPERASAAAGFAAGVTDFEAGSSAQAASARHRAMPRATDFPSTPAEAPQPPREQGTSVGGHPGDGVRTTADLDAMLALAGVTGAAVPGATVWPANARPVEVPHLAEAAEPQVGGGSSATAHRQPARVGLPLLDPAGRVSEAPRSGGGDDTAIVAHSRLAD